MRPVSSHFFKQASSVTRRFVSSFCFQNPSRSLIWSKGTCATDPSACAGAGVELSPQPASARNRRTVVLRIIVRVSIASVLDLGRGVRAVEDLVVDDRAFLELLAAHRLLDGVERRRPEERI